MQISWSETADLTWSKLLAYRVNSGAFWMSRLYIFGMLYITLWSLDVTVIHRQCCPCPYSQQLYAND